MKTDRLPDTKELDEGVDAYCLFQPRSACPYAASSREAQDWLRGWDEAKRIDEEYPHGKDWWH